MRSTRLPSGTKLKESSRDDPSAGPEWFGTNKGLRTGVKEGRKSSDDISIGKGANAQLLGYQMERRRS